MTHPAGASPSFHPTSPALKPEHCAKNRPLNPDAPSPQKAPHTGAGWCNHRVRPARGDFSPGYVARPTLYISKILVLIF
ncbi:hypothetical protein [Persicitalea jodogahamensis]|uniref:hypothetical protein n=1 Tax=Persicitalea jodogahamensis TaxID=402147 RepID=UPI00167A5329|nr:hypothetical protein [Persicitalea jodogahamensis]